MSVHIIHDSTSSHVIVNDTSTNIIVNEVGSNLIVQESTIGPKGPKGDPGSTGALASISTDANNRMTTGSDDNFFVPELMIDPLAYYILAKS